MIYPDDPFRKVWDYLLVLYRLVSYFNCRCLGYTAIVMPIRITFFDDSYIGWVVVDWIFDSLFFIDLFINFVTAYFDDEDNIVVD